MPTQAPDGNEFLSKDHQEKTLKVVNPNPRANQNIVIEDQKKKQGVRSDGVGSEITDGEDG